MPPTPDHWSDAGDLSSLDLSDDSHPFGVAEGRRYEPGAVLGQGGMGTVHAAFDRRLMRQVALKLPREGGAAGRRLAQEAWVTAQLDHPGIVTVHDAGVDAQGRPWYVMRVVRGRTLESLLEGQDQDARLEQLRALRDACEAVGYAHRNGFVHRDLKPANVMVGSFGETQVMDWGLARPAPGEAGARWRTHLPPELAAQTAEGSVLGTPAYLAPELLEGAAAGAAADVWSLGLVLFEILAGHRAFQGQDSQAVLAQVRAGRLPELQLPERLSPLGSLLARATARDPQRRFADAKELADELTRFLEGRRLQTHRYSPVQLLRETLAAWRLPLGLALGGLLAAAGVAGFALHNAREEARRASQAEQQADENLRLALLSQARTASRAGDRGRAETLAAHALELGEDPDARGILLDARPRPKLLASAEPLDCGRLDLDNQGRFAVCLEDEQLTLWDLASDARLWTQRVANASGAQVDSDGWVLVSAGDRHLLLDQGGHQVFQAVGSGAPTWLSDTPRVFLAKQGLFVSQPDGTVERVHDCPQGSGEAITSHGDRVVGVCFGEVFVWQDGVVHAFPTTQVSETLGFPQLVAADEDRLVWASQTGHLVAHSLEGGALLWSTSLPVGSVIDLSLGQGILAVTGVREGVHILDADTGRVLSVLPELPGTTAAGQHDRKLRVLGGGQRLWSLPMGHPQRVDGGITSLDFSADGERLAIAHGRSASVLEWGSGALQPVDPEPYAVAVKTVDLLPDGRLLLGLTQEQRLVNSQLELIASHPFGGRRSAWLQGGYILSASYALTGPNLKALSGADAPNIHQLDRPTLDIDTLPDGSQAVWANADGVWWMDAQALQPTLVLALPQALMAAVGPDLVLGATRTRVQVVDLQGAPLWSLDDPRQRVVNARFSADGRWLALGFMDGSASLHDARSGRLLAHLEGHTQQVPGLAFHPSGDTLVTGSWDRGLRTWDLTRLAQEPQALREQVHASWGLDLEQALR